jgi:hypothetical protein
MRQASKIAVGIGRAVPTAVIGTAYTDDLTVGTDFCLIPTVGTVYVDS